MSENKIFPRPDLPERIKNAAKKRRLAIFIGAGVSRIIGCMGWDQLAKNLIERCYGEHCITFKVKEKLLQNNNQKRIITTCYEILSRNDKGKEFFEELEKSLKAKCDLLKEQNIYNELIGFGSIFITTNADRHFDEKFEKLHRLYYLKDFDYNNIKTNVLYHIHGSLYDEESLVFTVPQYIERYNDANFQNFLNKIFKEYTILFIGYGMNEFELLDYLATKIDLKKELKELKRFILSPYYSGEEAIMECDQYYYEKLGVKIIGYEKDEKGYTQLYDVIKHWREELDQILGLRSNDQETIDRIVK